MTCLYDSIFNDVSTGASLGISQDGCHFFNDGGVGSKPLPRNTFYLHYLPCFTRLWMMIYLKLISYRTFFVIFSVWWALVLIRTGAWHPFPNLSGCLGTPGTRSNDGPVLRFNILIQWLNYPNYFVFFSLSLVSFFIVQFHKRILLVSWSQIKTRVEIEVAKKKS